MGIKVMGIDPGKKTGVALVLPQLQSVNTVAQFFVPDTGWCEWLDLELHTYEPTHVVYEDFIQETKDTDGVDERHFPQPTCKVIGALIHRCYQLQLPCIRQSRTVKPIGYGILGLKYPPPKDDHIHGKDAASHAAYLIKNGTRYGNGKEYRFFDYAQGRQAQRSGASRR